MKRHSVRSTTIICYATHILFIFLILCGFYSWSLTPFVFSIFFIAICVAYIAMWTLDCSSPIQNDWRFFILPFFSLLLNVTAWNDFHFQGHFTLADVADGKYTGKSLLDQPLAYGSKLKSKFTFSLVFFWVYRMRIRFAEIIIRFLD